MNEAQSEVWNFLPVFFNYLSQTGIKKLKQTLISKKLHKFSFRKVLVQTVKTYFLGTVDT